MAKIDFEKATELYQAMLRTKEVYQSTPAGIREREGIARIDELRSALSQAELAAATAKEEARATEEYAFYVHACKEFEASIHVHDRHCDDGEHCEFLSERGE